MNVLSGVANMMDGLERTLVDAVCGLERGLVNVVCGLVNVVGGFNRECDEWD